jgi:predicted nucleic acid-binding Zn ribbon protein
MQSGTIVSRKWAGLFPMHCNECGTEIPEGSRFCNGCGRPIQQNISAQDTSGEQSAHAARRAPEAPTAIAAEEAATPSYVIEPEKQTSRTPQILLVLLGISVVALVLMLSMGQRQSGNSGVTTQARSIAATSTVRTENVKLAAGAFTVQPGRYSFSKFTVPQKCTNVRVQGRFTSSGGSENGIEVYILSERELANWKNGHQAQKLYNSGRVTAEAINLRLPPTSNGQTATYYIVFNNKFSAQTSKALRADVSLYYERGL